ncbi:UDP-glycosyltransferase 79B6-like [Euphorbia lathyris]|uniref:UDP-glycosyltransferase 79B6-like n=1 Tax=Euphorbia lathyris TaxID=212925 RepID=UPI003313782F
MADHIVMFPWIAMGHITPFLQLSNKFAQKGYTITFLLPNKAIQQLQNLNLYPNQITFHPLTIPPVEGLPPGTETASDIPIQLTHLLSIAFDQTRDQVQKIIQQTKPKLVFYDFSHWLPEITRDLGIVAIDFIVVCAASIAIGTVPSVNLNDLSVLPTGYPSSTVLFRGSEIHSLSFVSLPFGDGITFYDRITTALKNSDAIAVRTCDETEGKFCDFIGSEYNKPVFLTGPILPDPPKTPLEDKWDKWLSGFEKNSVVFCAFGTQVNLEKDQFQELVLGFETTGLPFFLALKAPQGAASIEEALPDGFEDRVKGRGVVWGGWVEQVKILNHPSVGCFVSHCGFGSMWESLMNDCQIVLIPHLGDQILNTRLLVDELKIAVEVEKDENGWYSKENVGKAIKTMMDKDSELGSTLNKNHTKWREVLVDEGFLIGYIDKFVKNIQQLIN